MSTVLVPPQKLEPAPRRFSAEEYYQLVDLGMFQNQRVELIDGEVLQIAAQKNLHAAGITLAAKALEAAFGDGYWIRVQASLDLSPYSVPDPDLAVIKGSPKNPPKSNPTSALLILEVSETTLHYDRGDKSSLYAASGIADYWVVSVLDRWLEIRRNPQPDPVERFGFTYANVTRLAPVDFATPLAAPNARIRVEDLLP